MNQNEYDPSRIFGLSSIQYNQEAFIERVMTTNIAHDWLSSNMQFSFYLSKDWSKSRLWNYGLDLPGL